VSVVLTVPGPSPAGATELNASDDLRLIFSNNTNNQTLTRTFTGTEWSQSFDAMFALEWRVEHRQQGRVDDTLSLDIRIVNGSTVLAAADSAGTFVQVSGNVTSDTDISTGPLNFAYVNTAAARSLWQSATIELRQRFVATMGSDNCRVEVDYVELKAYVAIDADPPVITSLQSGNQQVEVIGWTEPANMGSGTLVARQYTTDNGATWQSLPIAGGVDLGLQPDVSGAVFAIAIQSDGKIVIGGSFLTVEGITQNRIARLNTDGSLDTGFNTGGTVGVSGDVQAIAIQSDGKILIGGFFVTARGVTQNSIARLNADGSLDTGFNTGGTIGFNGPLYAFAIQSDGKIVVGGQFTTARGVTQNSIARLNTNGSLDTGFNTGGTVGLGGTVSVAYALAIQSDSKIVVGGQFTTARGVTQYSITRLNTDGTYDTGFNTGSNVGTDLGSEVFAVAIRSDGKIVIGGAFVNARGVVQNNIARLNTDGSRDTGFNTGGTVGTSSQVSAVAIQSDGKIVIGGSFLTARGVTQNRIARLNTADGSLDTGFNTGGTVGVGSTVYAIATQSDGKIVVGGQFTTVRGARVFRVARLFAVTSFVINETSE
jgi:uncharacterized delta-60 repeat protein